MYMCILYQQAGIVEVRYKKMRPSRLVIGYHSVVISLSSAVAFAGRAAALGDRS
jgi:hypothetical protein